MNDLEFKRALEILEQENQLPADVRCQRMIDHGIIEEDGRSPLWYADLAVVAIQHDNGSNKILHVRCLKPKLGQPGFGEVVLSRESLLEFIAQGSKRIIVATHNVKFNRWKEGPEIHVTPRHHLRIDAQIVEEDYLGELPSFVITNHSFAG